MNDVDMRLDAQSDVPLSLDSATVQVAPPEYAGPYFVTPARNVQIIATKGMALASDVTVEAIPAQYPDVSSDTVTAGVLKQGYTAHDASGAAITGTMDGGGGENYLVNRFAEHDTALEFAADADTCGALTSVGDYAFYKCQNLTSVSLPSLTSVGSYAFYKCQSMTSVSLPECTSVGTSAFTLCSNLTSVSLPECTSVGDYAFYECKKLKVVWCNGSGLDTLRSEYSYIGLSSADMLRDASDVVALFADKSAVMASANGATVAVEAFTSDGSTPTITADNGCVVDGTTVTIPASVAGGTTVTITATSGTHSTTATVSVLGADPACIVSGNGFEFDSVDGSGHYVYRSTNYNVNNSIAKAKVTISGNGTYTIHVKNSGEADCDYFEASALDATDIVRDGSTNVLKAKDIMDDFTATHDYVVSDGGTHSFIVCFSKDASVAKGLDRAFFYVTKA